MPAEFVHLHVHSQYSMLDGSIRLKSLARRVKELGMKAVALTDHGNMFGAVQHHKACKEAGIAPILGCEVNLVTGHRADPKERAVYHLNLLAKDADGYQNLVRLVSLGWVEGHVHGLPRIDFELLEKHKKGIVGLTACMGGWVAQEVLMRGARAGEAAMARLRDCFEPGSFFVELQDHGFLEQVPLNRILVESARKLELPIVASNDCHYDGRTDARAQLVLQCIATGMPVEDAQRAHHGSEEIFLKSPEEMAVRFAELPEALAGTLLVAEMCAGRVDPNKKPMLPRFPVPDLTSEDAYFRKLAEAGLESRFNEMAEVGKKVDEEAYRRRLKMECDVICKMGFPGYFLIVADFINWGKENGVPVGPGRGSGAGSIAAWSLRITDLDPIPYGLLFERFLNPERVSMPDFDVDFCMDKRDRVIDYVRRKYGESSVGQIATFHLLKSRSVVKDVGRVTGWSVQDASRIASMVPEPVQGKTVGIAKAMEQEPKLKALYDEEPRAKELLDTAMRLEDLTRHAGMHAAGIVISEGPLWDHVPVFCPEPNVYVTQYHKDDVESAGLVKFDFLGLKTLTVLDICVRLIDKRPDRDKAFRLDRIPLDDKATFALLQSGETTNVFQLESSGMQDMFKQLKPDCFEDIVAAISLYRPGPMDLIPDFIACKHGKKKIEYPHPLLVDTLKETYGVFVYQEQVMRAAQEMAGYSLGGADLLRRAMGKKKAEEMAKQKDTFVDGAAKKGVSAEDAKRVFDRIETFAGYGFNKSHAAAYALISYQTAYLKTHYPVEFVCATLTADKDKIDKVVRTVAEARTMGITVLPPDINESDLDFSVVYEKLGEAELKKLKRKKDTPVAQGGKVRDPEGPRIRFGLGGVKGLGQAALEAAFEARSTSDDPKAPKKKTPFTDLYDFAARVDVRRVNKAVVEALVQCGAFDAVHKPLAVSRAQAFAAIDGALERGRRMSAERASGQTNLFGLFSAAAPAAKQRGPEFPRAEPWDVRETLVREKNALGFYVSGHPLDRYARELTRLCNATTLGLASLAEGAKITIAGSVEGYRERPTKTGGKIGFFALEDGVGRVEVIVRPKVLDAAREVLVSSEPVIVTGTLQLERSGGGGEDETEGGQVEAKVILESIATLGNEIRSKARSLRVRLVIPKLRSGQLGALRQALDAHPGTCPVAIELSSPGEWKVQLPQTGITVEPSEALRSSLERLFGENVCDVK